jgi:hypothetical protein
MTNRDLTTIGSFLREGWQEKYVIPKANGHPVDPDSIYFPLRLDNDPYAREAALHYAKLIRNTNPKLADDIENKVREGEEIHIRNSGYGE